MPPRTKLLLIRIAKLPYLKSANCRRLEAQISLEILGDFTDETLKVRTPVRTVSAHTNMGSYLEWQFADEELGGLLVATNLTQSHGSRAIAMWFLDASTRRGRFAGCLNIRQNSSFAKIFAIHRL